MEFEDSLSEVLGSQPEPLHQFPGVAGNTEAVGDSNPVQLSRANLRVSSPRLEMATNRSERRSSFSIYDRIAHLAAVVILKSESGRQELLRTTAVYGPVRTMV